MKKNTTLKCTVISEHEDDGEENEVSKFEYSWCNHRQSKENFEKNKLG